MCRKEEPKTQSVAEISTGVAQAANVSAATRETPAAPPISSRAPACISQGIKIHGDITGDEDLFVDGRVEGKLELGRGSLTIGPNGNVKADLSAREVVVRGRVDGKVAARERLHLWNTGQLIGEVTAERLTIEDGAVLRGRAEVAKHGQKHGDAFKSPPEQQDQKKAEPHPVPAGPAAD